jgi:DNA-binding LacI/PurR family transcriptional regulator
MPATIRDVARKANVGIGTVSRVLNDSPAVREDTRQKVLAAIEDLNFTPNPIARRLSTGQTFTIGVILPYLTMPSYIERLRGVQNVLADSNYDLVLFDVLLISLPPNDEQANRFTNSNIPTVLIDAYHPDLCCVYPDDIEGGRIATKHLIDLGHRKIGYLSDYLSTPYHPSMRLRYQGYRETLEKDKIKFYPKYHVESDRGRIKARKMAKNILTMDDPPTAIFAASDSQAIGILDAANEMGMNIPEDLSVIGYDDIRDAAYVNLTTINQHLVKSGVSGAQMLLDMLAEPDSKARNNQKLAVDLVVRGTTGPPRQ